MFPNFWQEECSGGAPRLAWKRSGLRLTLNAAVSKVDNLVWLPCARKKENWSRGPTVDEFCAGTCAYCPRLYGDPGPTKVLPGPTVTFFSAGTHGCRPKVGDPQRNWTLRDSPTYVAFLDYSTAYPSVHRGRLAVLLHQFIIVEKMWHHLCNRFNSVKLRVLHPGIAPHQTVQILRGLPEGSRLK